MKFKNEIKNHFQIHILPQTHTYVKLIIHEKVEHASNTETGTFPHMFMC